MTISEAPLYRTADANNCAKCVFFQALDMEEGICTKFDFKTECEYVCDAFSPAPVAEAQPVEVVAMPAMMSVDITEDMLVNFGGAVKALNGIQEPDYAIVYGGQDLTDDYFDKNTEYGFAGAKTKRVPILFHHAQPLETADEKQYQVKSPIGEAELEITDEGVLITQAILYNRAKYEAHLASLGWSTGAASHAVDREERGGKSYVKQWLLSELSVTPMSAEPRIKNVIALKSLVTSSKSDVEQQEQVKAAGQDKPEAATKPEPIQEVKSIGVEKMELDEVKLQEMLTQAAEAGATKAIAATEPVKSSGGHVQVIEAAEDRPFKSIAENLLAIKADVLSHGNSDNQYPRMRYLKATGASEGVPTDGGLLLDPTLSAEIIKPMHDAGPFSNAVRRLPVGNNSNYGWLNAVDETSRATGSRWGGIRGYRLAEAATKTASKPTFRRINWELKKYAAVVVATDELLADVSMFSEIVRTGVAEELNFMLNDDIMNGIGVAGPQGFMQSGALITVTRTTGSKILGEDISAMYNRMDLRGRATCNWYIGNDSTPQLDNLFAVGSTAVLYPYASIGADGIKYLYGRPVITTEFNASLNTTGDIALVDPQQYLLWEKGGVQAESSIHVYFLSDETAFRFVYRVDGKSSVASALTPYKGSTTTSPFVVLTSAT